MACSVPAGSTGVLINQPCGLFKHRCWVFLGFSHHGARTGTQDLEGIRQVPYHRSILALPSHSVDPSHRCSIVLRTAHYTQTVHHMYAPYFCKGHLGSLILWEAPVNLQESRQICIVYIVATEVQIELSFIFLKMYYEEVCAQGIKVPFPLVTIVSPASWRSSVDAWPI